MIKRKLKTAVLGLDDRGKRLLDVINQINAFSLEAVADRDSILVEKTAMQYKCKGYDDYRQLIIQSQLDCLIVAAGTHSCSEHIKTAIKKKFNILKLNPLARDFTEASSFVTLAKEENVIFSVANLLRFSQRYHDLRKFIEHDEKNLLVTADLNVDAKVCPAWHNDPKLAGGGVLLHNSYEIIDQILLNFNMPQQVFSLNINIANDRQQKLYLTEGIVVTTMNLPNEVVVNIIACKSSRPKHDCLKIYGKDKMIIMDNTQLTVVDNLGKTEKQLKYNDDDNHCMIKALEKFAENIILSDTSKIYSSAEENLKNMAIIESAYLSARTGMPEEPQRILKMK